jgi:peroxiredoxin
MIRTVLFSFVMVGLLGSAGIVHAQGKFNEKVKIGDQAPVYSNLPGTDGKMHSLSDLSGKDIVVVVITCNHCPVAQNYENRLINFTKKYVKSEGSKVALVAINVNNGDDDKLPKMIERAKEKGFNFPYLYDASQKIGRDFGATVTPEFFVLNKERKIVYTGTMDDAQKESKVTKHYLTDAVDAALKGQTPTMSETRPFGCGVQYDK